MSPVAERIMLCRHCGAEFTPTEVQWRHRKRGSYCGSVCRAAANPLRKPIPLHGPCQTCGKMFASRTAKQFCDMKCYVGSPTFKQMLAANSLKRNGTVADKRFERRNGHVLKHEMACLECGVAFFASQAQIKRGKKFCSHDHYRLYMSKRFDRWTANPKAIGLVQNYDEFMTSDLLPCLVEGCGWSGHHLSVHLNSTHGIAADDFKRAAGFNLNTGLVSRPLHLQLCERPLHGVPLCGADRPPSTSGSVRNYSSREGREHYRKAIALRSASSLPPRTCVGCGTAFSQLNPTGRTRFCSIDCRQRHYAAQDNARTHPMECAQCGSCFQGSSYQLRRAQLPGGKVVCSNKCRALLNAPRGKRVPLIQCGTRGNT